jgi:hypothetical protein
MIDQHVDGAADARAGDARVLLDAVVRQQGVLRLVRSKRDEREVQLERAQVERAADAEPLEAVRLSKCALGSFAQPAAS